MPTHTAYVTADDRWWLVSVPELDVVTQAQHLRDIDRMAREVIAVRLDVPLSEIAVQVRVTGPSVAV
ncbi:hypothetical protein [Nakamurella leprariae]|uniref:Type II toxin-antitoxin system HicB family antitoxin n=1 Tax=Nakamurella leprariae TaxID=2803911 RepID=A0A938YII4_9ACTN|nr:hypothetical protein [Nakamurella leprariae]MBM9468779.1 hypothetical protein [Nakamurella leprariae]